MIRKQVLEKHTVNPSLIYDELRPIMEGLKVLMEFPPTHLLEFKAFLGH